MREDLSTDVVIVGAGVAGAGLANQLGGSGLDVVLLDANATIPVINRGDQVSPPSVQALGRAGALPYFWRLGAIRIRHWQAIGPEGDEIASIDLQDIMEPPYDYILSLAHSSIHGALVDSAKRFDNVRVIRGLRVTDLLQEHGAVAGVVGRRQGDEIRVRARAVAGADGPHSTVRTKAGIESPIQEHPYHYLMLTATRHPSQGADWNKEYWTASGFIGMFPLSGPDWVRCPIEAVPGSVSRWKSQGLRSLHEELCEWQPLWKDMSILDHDLHFYKVTQHHTPAYAADGVFLLGDAAHTTPPYLGMGMNMGIREGVIAARALREALASQETLTAQAMSVYAESARDFANFVISASSNYGSVAAAKHRTQNEVSDALATSSALDPAVLGRVYVSYE